MGGGQVRCYEIWFKFKTLPISNVNSLRLIECHPMFHDLLNWGRVEGLKGSTVKVGTRV